MLSDVVPDSGDAVISNAAITVIKGQAGSLHKFVHDKATAVHT